MPIGTPVSLGSTAGTGSGNTVVIPVGTSVSAGDHVILGAGSSASGFPASATDTKGNTYQLDKSDATLRGVGILSGKVTTPLVGGTDSITITFSATGSGNRFGWAFSVSGLDQTTWVDKTNTANAATGLTWNGGATGSLAQADELVVATAYHATNTTSLPNASYTEIADVGNASGNLAAVYRIVAATTSETPGGTWSSSGSQWDGVGVTYKMAISGAAPTNTVAPAVTGTATIGNTLTTSDGSWANTPTSFAYQWQSDFGSAGSTFTDLAGDTANTHAVVKNDIGCRFRCRVVATNASGSSAPVASNSTSAVPVPSGTITWRVVAPPLAQSDEQVHPTTLALPVLPGDLMVLCVGCSNADLVDGNGNKADQGAVLDSKGNTWTQIEEAFFSAGNATNPDPRNGTIANSGQMFTAVAATQMVGGVDTVTMYNHTIGTMPIALAGTDPLAYHGSSPFWFIVAISTGDSRTLTLDGVDHNVDVLTTHAPATGVTTSGSNAIVLGFHVSGGNGAAGWWTPAAGFTEVCDTAQADALGGESPYNIASEVQVVTGGYTGAAGGTTASNKKVTNLVAAFTAAAATTQGDPMASSSGPNTLAPTGSTGNNTHASVYMPDGAEVVAVQFVVEAVGATPTVTWTPQGSLDGTNWYPLPYITDATATESVTGRVATAVGTQISFMAFSSRWFRRVRLVTTANTNVTYRADIYTVDRS